MATQTPNLGLTKPAYSETADIADINNNMDKVDAAVNGVQNGMAILANGNVHSAVTSGQYVYVRNHGTLAEGLYTATTNISTNATLSTSNLTAVPNNGALNTLRDDVSSLSSKITTSTTIITDGIITLYVKKSANIVNVNIPFTRAKTSIAANSATEIATLPDGYRPTSNIFSSFLITGSTGNLVAYVRVAIYATGKVEFYASQAISTGTDLFGSFDFCV